MHSVEDEVLEMHAFDRVLRINAADERDGVAGVARLALSMGASAPGATPEGPLAAGP